MFAAAHRLAVGVYMGDRDLALGKGPRLADQVADAVEALAWADLGSGGRCGESEKNHPREAHDETCRLELRPHKTMSPESSSESKEGIACELSPYGPAGRPSRPSPGNFSAGRRRSSPSTPQKKFSSIPSTQPMVRPR